jgi:G3E family GTPase
MSEESRIPLWIAVAPDGIGRERLALIMTASGTAPPGYAVTRHADAAAIAQKGGCACCRVPSDLVSLLRRLFLERVRGETVFDGIVITGPAALAAEAMTDPLVSARYEIRPINY